MFFLGEKIRGISLVGGLKPFEKYFYKSRISTNTKGVETNTINF